MAWPSKIISSIGQFWRRRSEYRTLAALSAASALLAAVRLAEPLLDDPMVNSVGDSLLTPVLVAVACAFSLSSHNGEPSTEALAPISRMLDSLRPSLGIVRVLRGVLQELVHLTEAREIILVLEGRGVRRLTLASLAWDGAAWVESALKHLPRNERETYFFKWPHADGDSRGAADRCDSGARLTVLTRTNAHVPGAFTSAHEFTRMYAVAFTCEDGWRGRLFVLDPKHEARPSFVQGFERTLNHLLPAAVGVGDLHALRRRAAAQERVRLARELHDGVVQELLNVDVEIELLRRRPDADWITVREQLGGVQQQLRDQVSGLRTLLQQARSHDGSTSKLPALLANVVQRFGREHGINAEYKASIAQLRLPARVSSEMVRIVQEALVNVRRHSGARHVAVTLDGTGDELILGIQDDGRGFPIAMPAPSIVDDRVQGIGGTVHVMAVERGARLEVRLPRNGPWTKNRKSELSSPTITRYSETG